MYCPNRKKHPQIHSDYRRGFTLIEILIALAVLGLFFTATAFILQQILENIASGRIRTAALSLAQEKMETIRNLPYNQVGTVGGVPNGAIAPNENVTLNGHQMNVSTIITYIDDPFDGTSPTDPISSDYKRVQVSVNWTGIYPSRVPITLVTNIVYSQTEEDLPGGTLYIQVSNASGNPVPNATVTIDNDSVNPQIHTQIPTDNDGLVILPGYPPCISCYGISVTKYGYSTDRTYSISEVANPVKPDASVFEDQITQLSFSIDEVSLLTIRSYNQLYQPIGNVIFSVHGQKVIGYDTLDEPVYKYNNTTTTGGFTVTLSALETDIYTLDFTPSFHTLAGSYPLLPVPILPKSAITVPIVAVPKTAVSLHMIVTDAFNTPQASAAATIIHTGSGNQLTQFTHATGSADFGQTFFGGLSGGDWDYRINLAGFAEATGSMELTTNHSKWVKLNQL